MQQTTLERQRLKTSLPSWITTKKSATVVNQPALQKGTGDVFLARQLTTLHAEVMHTVEGTNPVSELHARLCSFARGVLVAIELAEVMKPLWRHRQVASEAKVDEPCSLGDLSKLAYQALSTGRKSQGFLVLEGIGSLLGGPPRAALEHALGLIHLKQNSAACEFLEKALDGSSDSDGTIAALLAQLWFEARNPRWIALAKKVLATGLNRDARIRCTELLATVHMK